MLVLSFSLPVFALEDVTALARTTEDPETMVKYEPLAQEQTDWKDLKDEIVDSMPLVRLSAELEKRQQQLIEAQTALESGVAIVETDQGPIYRYQNFGKLAGLAVSGVSGFVGVIGIIDAFHFKDLKGIAYSSLVGGIGIAAGVAITGFAKYLDKPATEVVELTEHQRERLLVTMAQLNDQITVLKNLIASIHQVSKVR